MSTAKRPSWVETAEQQVGQFTCRRICQLGEAAPMQATAAIGHQAGRRAKLVNDGHVAELQQPVYLQRRNWACNLHPGLACCMPAQHGLTCRQYNDTAVSSNVYCSHTYAVSTINATAMHFQKQSAV